MVDEPRWLFWLVLLVVLVVLVSFSDKPFFIDDPLFLRAAEQIQKHPGDFYGFKVNWWRSATPMVENFFNPPFACYYLAAAAAIAGWSERSLHLAFLIPVILVVPGIYQLARRHCRRPALAAGISVLNPIFLLCASTLMCDTWLMAFWVWSVVVFEKALDGRRLSLFILSGALAGMAYLTKFPGIALVGLLLAYGVLKERRFGRWVLAPSVPVVFALAYELITWRVYGVPHFIHATFYSGGEAMRQLWWTKTLVGLNFLGGGFPIVLLFSAWLWRPFHWGAFASLVLALVVVIPHVPAFSAVVGEEQGSNWWVIGQASIWIGSVVMLSCVAGACLLRDRSPASWMLVLWFFGVLIFAVFLNWTVNGRSLLPLLPAAGILLVRALDALSGPPSKHGPVLALPLLPAVVISIFLLDADTKVARSDRENALKLHAKYAAPGRVVWFEGHWGFQYYLEQLGARPLDLARPEIAPGDVLLVPNYGPAVETPDLKVFELIHAREYLPNRRLTTVNLPAGACFYASARGPFPFVFRRLTPEQCFVFRLRQAPASDGLKRD
jgi:4-amino-4-deoxy-L-arabinose transferase-like glycosyltransferase